MKAAEEIKEAPDMIDSDIFDNANIDEVSEYLNKEIIQEDKKAEPIFFKRKESKTYKAHDQSDNSINMKELEEEIFEKFSKNLPTKLR